MTRQSAPFTVLRQALLPDGRAFQHFLSSRPTTTSWDRSSDSRRRLTCSPRKCGEFGGQARPMGPDNRGAAGAATRILGRGLRADPAVMPSWTRDRD